MLCIQYYLIHNIEQENLKDFQTDIIKSLQIKETSKIIRSLNNNLFDPKFLGYAQKQGLSRGRQFCRLVYTFGINGETGGRLLLMVYQELGQSKGREFLRFDKEEKWRDTHFFHIGGHRIVNIYQLQRVEMECGQQDNNMKFLCDSAVASGSVFKGSGRENYSNISKAYFPRCTWVTDRVSFKVQVNLLLRKL